MNTRQDDSPTLRHWIGTAIAFPALLFLPEAFANFVVAVLP